MSVLLVVGGALPYLSVGEQGCGEAPCCSSPGSLDMPGEASERSYNGKKKRCNLHRLAYDTAGCALYEGHCAFLHNKQKREKNSLAELKQTAVYKRTAAAQHRT